MEKVTMYKDSEGKVHETEEGVMKAELSYEDVRRRTELTKQLDIMLDTCFKPYLPGYGGSVKDWTVRGVLRQLIVSDDEFEHLKSLRRNYKKTSPESV